MDGNELSRILEFEIKFSPRIMYDDDILLVCGGYEDFVPNDLNTKI